MTHRLLSLRKFGKYVVAATCLTTLLVQPTLSYAEDTLARVKESGQIAVGARESSGALSYLLGSRSEYLGYQIDLCKRIIAGIQKQLALPKLEVKYHAVTAQNRIPLITNKTIDIECGSTANNLTRQRDVAFSYTTFVEETRIAVKKSSGITSIDQLAGKRVVTTTGTTSVQTLRKYAQNKGVKFEETFGKDHADSFLLLESGRADAFVMDGQVLAGLIANSRVADSYQIVGEPLAVEPVAIVFRKDDPGMKKVVNETLADLYASGEIQKVYAKWFMEAIPPNNAKLNLPASRSTLAAWATPNEKPVEDFASK